MRPASSASTAHSVQLAFAPTLALDIGGSKTRIGRFAAPTATFEYTPLATFPTEMRYAAQMARIACELEPVCHQVGLAGFQLAGVGVSFGGRISRDGLRVAVAPNLPDFEGKPLVGDLAELCGCPVRLAHDPVCGLLAERHYGALAAAERCAYLTVSTGTGAALHLANQTSSASRMPSIAAHGVTLSIEVGHQVVAAADAAARSCICGQVGCLETYTGGKQLSQRYGRPLEEIDDRRVWEELTSMLAVGLINLAQLARVELVAVSGAIALHREGFIVQVQHEVDRRLRGATLRLVPAQLGDRAPLVGAALLLETPEEDILH